MAATTTRRQVTATVVQPGSIGSLKVGSAGDSAAALADPIIVTVGSSPR